MYHSPFGSNWMQSLHDCNIYCEHTNHKSRYVAHTEIRIHVWRILVGSGMLEHGTTINTLNRLTQMRKKDGWKEKWEHWECEERAEWVAKQSTDLSWLARTPHRTVRRFYSLHIQLAHIRQRHHHQRTQYAFAYYKVASCPSLSPSVSLSVPLPDQHILNVLFEMFCRN